MATTAPKFYRRLKPLFASILNNRIERTSPSGYMLTDATEQDMSVIFEFLKQNFDCALYTRQNMFPKEPRSEYIFEIVTNRGEAVGVLWLSEIQQWDNIPSAIIMHCFTDGDTPTLESFKSYVQKSENFINWEVVSFTKGQHV